MAEKASDKTILIIEDDPDLADALQTKLAAAGFLVVVRSDGEAGLQTALKDHPDVILLDVMLPIINGLQVLNRLRNDPWGKEVHIIMLTNRDDAQSVSEADRNKCDSYIVKTNYSLDEITEIVKIQAGVV